MHTQGAFECRWDPAKAAANFRKHKVRFSAAALALEDPAARTMADPDATDEERFISLGVDPLGNVLVTVFAARGTFIRNISSRKASRAERRVYEARR